MPPKLSKRLAPLAPWLAKQRRDAWKPVVRKGDGPPTASKFAGTPYLPKGESWPACGKCRDPMRLFFQINLDELPDGADRYGTGLLQLFVCLKEDCVYLAGYGDPFNKCQLVRVVKANKPAAEVAVPTFKDDADVKRFPAKSIVGWKPVDDYPSFPDLERLGLVQDFEKDVLVFRELGLEFNASFDDVSDAAACFEKEKLGGWPKWQNIATEYPTCPKCSKMMTRSVFQVCDGHVPHMLGDGGVGQVFQCGTHKGVVGFVWTSG